MRTWLTWAGVLSVVVLVAGCGSGGPQPATTGQQRSDNTEIGGYLFASPRSVVFVQITTTGNQISGTMYDDYEDQTQTYQTSESSISGAEDGNAVTLSVASSGESLNGTFHQGTLVLGIPQSDGSIQSIVLKRANLNAYNNAVQQVRATVSADQNASAQAQQISNQETRINNLDSEVSGDIQQLSNLSAPGSLTYLANDITTEQNDLHTEYQDLQTEISDADNPQTPPGQVGADDGTVEADQGTVEADDGSVQADYSGFQNDLEDIQATMSDLTQSYKALNNAMTQLPSYSPSAPLPNAADVNGALSTASQDVNAYTKTAKQYLSEDDAMLQQAQDYANQADQISNNHD